VVLLDCIVPGQPVPKGRPRAFVCRGFARLYTPAKTVAAERALALLVRGVARPTCGLPAHGNLRVKLAFVCARKPGRRPDLDNLVKLVLDALNGVIWADDNQVTELKADMVISGAVSPRTAITVETIRAVKDGEAA
jgi:Holliday junction resolvase RusA-like endonuclease